MHMDNIKPAADSSVKHVNGFGLLQAASSLSVSKPDHVTKHPQRLAPIGQTMGSKKLSHDISSTEADSVAAASTADARITCKTYHTDPRDSAGGFHGLQNDVMPSSSAAESNVAHLSVSPLRLVSHVGWHPVSCCALLCCDGGISHNKRSMRADLLNCLALQGEILYSWQVWCNRSSSPCVTC